MLLNPANQVWVGRRIDNTDEAWQMPQGGIDPGEDPYRAALRELHEETNVRSVTFLAEAPEWYSYDLPSLVAGRAWKGRYRGQIQKWFAFRFEGDEAEIDVARPGGGGHRPEFVAWRWERLERVPKLIVPFKREVYATIVEGFRGKLPNS